MRHHPLSETCPPTADAESQDLKADIAANGLFLDGQHRERACRRERVAKMAATGMSKRAIAAAIGVNEITVRRDMMARPPCATDVAPAPPAPPTAREVPAVSPDPPPPGAGAGSGAAPPPAPENVTGLDGKQYPASRPKPPAPKSTPKPPPTWAAFQDNLSATCEFAKCLQPTAVPEEVPSWQVVKSLTEAARTLMAAASRLQANPR